MAKGMINDFAAYIRTNHPDRSYHECECTVVCKNIAKHLIVNTIWTSNYWQITIDGLNHKYSTFSTQFQKMTYNKSEKTLTIKHEDGDIYITPNL